MGHGPKNGRTKFFGQLFVLAFSLCWNTDFFFLIQTENNYIPFIFFHCLKSKPLKQKMYIVKKANDANGKQLGISRNSFSEILTKFLDRLRGGYSR